MITILYLMKRKLKDFFEVISNIKIIYKILLNEDTNNQDFGKVTGGLDNVEYGI